VVRRDHRKGRVWLVEQADQVGEHVERSIQMIASRARRGILSKG
jgi:hypothetical protein